MKKILLIQGHPDKESYCQALANAYRTGALNAGAEIEVLNIYDLEFNPNLEYGYRKRTHLEPDLIAAQKKILWAEHIVVVHPLWWGGVPALLKGFFDRVLLPGFAFEKIENSLWWKKLLKGRTGRIICTMDQPAWFYRIFNGGPGYKALKRMTFEFCGITPVGITSIGPVRLSKESFRAGALEKVRKLGEKMK